MLAMLGVFIIPMLAQPNYERRMKPGEIRAQEKAYKRRKRDGIELIPKIGIMNPFYKIMRALSKFDIS